MFFIIAAIAAAILIYFAFYAKGETTTQTELLANATDDLSVEATVVDKQVTESGIKRNHYLMHIIIFECADGETREFSVTPKMFDEIKIGEREILVYKDSFIGFGNHGAVDTDSGNPSPDTNDNFTYDDFDESIDIEQEPDASVTLSYDDETRELLARFTDYEMLPAKSETVEDETDDLRSYSAYTILSKTTLYPFLKQENKVRIMFERTYNEAWQDLMGYGGNSRKGMAADSIYVNKNEIRVVITIQEAPAPLKSRVSTEFGVNE